MNPILILAVFISYSALLFIIAGITGRRSTNDTYFTGNRNSPWYIVAYGMVGASLSGVTFISIPGEVGASGFSYMVLVMGYLLGYAFIARVLLPVYYGRKLTSIYTYLEQRFGKYTYKTGASFFILSRSIGSSFRVFLVVNVLQIFVFDNWGIPFAVNVALFMGLILLYTFKGGIKTVVWTDTLQTTFMLAAVIVSVVIISRDMEMGLGSLINQVYRSDFSRMFFHEINDKRFYLKQFFSGAFIAVVMTGLDQDMMQKNLTCRNLKDAKKNIYLMSWSLVPVNLLFLFLGALLYLYVQKMGITLPLRSDDLFPLIALKHHGAFAGVVFLIGLVAAAYSSADGSLTALTTSFSIDILELGNNKNLSDRRKINIRMIVHFCFAVFLTGLVVLFRSISDQSVITKLFTIAGYTYGPLLGLYAFGLFTKRNVVDRYVPVIALVSPVLSYILSVNSIHWFNGYKFGFELLIFNGLITFLGLLIISDNHKSKRGNLN
ncbi:Sodium/glucose cotransporter [bioreactor metagenome]|uniref:Sodium/glucose cotransporter n=1 Tax=bioreactor metagenome TaxID=1076179 RepID=A0A644TSD3_9ZZZZ|nr:sodium:solute symporter [Lentimicrobium sp.]MEA5111285.1 sodium:solute symporter [Lentimicrobium sp.]